MKWQTLPTYAKITQKVIDMATMNISLPNEMKEWVEQQAHTGRYNNSSDYVRDLIRRDQDRTSQQQHLQQLITEGINSGKGSRSMDELRREALSRLASD